MSSKAKNYLLVLLAASTITAGLIAWNQHNQLAALQSDLLKASASAASVKPKPAPIAASFTAPAPAAPAEVEPAAPAEDPNAAQRQRANNNNGRPNLAALMANPAFVQAVTTQQRGALDAHYADLFKKLNLSPDQLAKFQNLLLERQAARFDVMNAARESGLNNRDNRDEIRKLTADAQAEVDANIKSALGETAFNQYKTYDATQSQRTVVSQLDQRLSYSSSPLTDTQNDFLVNALYASSTPSTGNDAAPQAGPGGNWGGRGNTTPITDKVIEQAKSVLTPAQVTALQQLQAEQKAEQQIRDLTRTNNNKPAATTGTATKAK